MTLFAAMGMPVANAVTAGPTLRVTEVDDGVVVASGSNFGDEQTVEVVASVEGVRKSVEITTDTDEHFLAGFRASTGFAGDMTITATVDDVTRRKTVTLGGESRTGGSSVAEASSRTTTKKKKLPAAPMNDLSESDDDASDEDSMRKPAANKASNARSANASGVGFVQRDGTQLTLDGRPWKFVGYNNINFVGCTNDERRIDDIDDYYEAVGSGVTDRVWVTPGSDLAKVDTMIAAAKKNNAKIYITLFDALGNCGPEWDDVKGDFESHIDEVVGRYKDEPTVAFWEIANEPPQDAAGFELLADYIKSIDQNHLVGTGTNAVYDDSDVSEFEAAGAVESIDILSMHEYDTKVAGASPHLDRILGSARELGKPIIIGEFGMDASPDGSGEAQTANNGCVSYAERGRLLQSKTNDYLDNAEVAGVSYWSIGGGEIGGCDTYAPLSDDVLLGSVQAMVTKWGGN